MVKIGYCDYPRSASETIQLHVVNHFQKVLITSLVYVNPPSCYLRNVLKSTN